MEMEMVKGGVSEGEWQGRRGEGLANSRVNKK